MIKKNHVRYMIISIFFAAIMVTRYIDIQAEDLITDDIQLSVEERMESDQLAEDNYGSDNVGAFGNVPEELKSEYVDALL